MPGLIKVSSISRFANEEKIRKLFGHIGDIRNIALKSSKLRDGLQECVIEFSKSDDAKLALMLDGTAFLDSTLRVDHHRDEDQLARIARTIRVDQVPPNATLEELRSFFSRVQGVRRMRLGNGVDPETNSAYAYVEFLNPEFQQTALKEMDGEEFLGEKIKVSPSRIAISKGKSTSTRANSPVAHSNEVNSPKKSPRKEAPASEDKETSRVRGNRRRSRSRSDSRQRGEPDDRKRAKR